MADDEMTNDEFMKLISMECDADYKAPHQPLVYEIGNLLPVYALCDRPPMKVATMIALIEECVPVGGEIPHRAFVSGPGMNYRFHLESYDADTHESMVADRLMEMIRRGADRIATMSEVWLRNPDGTLHWHGVMVTEATVLGDICHTAEFEAERRIGEWHSGPVDDRCDLTRLFRRAVAGNKDGETLQSTLEPLERDDERARLISQVRKSVSDDGVDKCEIIEGEPTDSENPSPSAGDLDAELDAPTQIDQLFKAAEDLEKFGLVLVGDATRIRESVSALVRHVRRKWLMSSNYCPWDDQEWVEASNSIPREMEDHPEFLDGVSAILSDVENVRQRAISEPPTGGAD